uniref:hypothetical protein n=1 Tax=Tsunamia transpacifica TaxID=1935457 RepID=UPI001BEDD4D3|nr:hypothetical protein MW473_pgp145 [Tsunamia transpacifica]QUE27843.1 Ycf20 [Tsunamia transpacifica]UNJ14358.1 hypothetical protein [Tsunamia transpacifica]
MQKTQILHNFLRYFNFYSIGYTSLKLLSLLIGFFLSTVLTTLVGQTGDWGIIAGAITVTYIELYSKWIYAIQYSPKKNPFINNFCSNLNSLRIGVVYGMFVDAFKLGS